MDNVNSQWSSRSSNNFINNITNNHKCCVFSSTKNQRINTTGNAFTNAAFSFFTRQILGLVPDRPVIPDDRRSVDEDYILPFLGHNLVTNKNSRLAYI